MKITFDLVDGSETADLVKAWADENGMPQGVTAGLLFVAELEKRPHGLREPGTIAKRMQERQDQEAAEKATAKKAKRTHKKIPPKARKLPPHNDKRSQP